MIKELSDEEIDAAVSEIFDECAEAQFGLWITGLFFWFPTLQFSDQKRAFFALLKRLLDEGYIKFVKPGADVYYNAELNPHPKLTINDEEAHWNAASDEIISFLESEWPTSAKDETSLELNTYFYTIPSIIWKGDDGKWYGS